MAVTFIRPGLLPLQIFIGINKYPIDINLLDLALNLLFDYQLANFFQLLLLTFDIPHGLLDLVLHLEGVHHQILRG